MWLGGRWGRGGVKGRSGGVRGGGGGGVGLGGWGGGEVRKGGWGGFGGRGGGPGGGAPGALKGPPGRAPAGRGATAIPLADGGRSVGRLVVRGPLVPMAD